MARRTTRIAEELNSLNKEDIYSLMLFTMYKIKDNPDYLTLIELCYILDGDNLNKFLRYFGGMTITVPESKDLRLMLQALRLYQFVNLEKGSFEEGLKGSVTEEFSADEIKGFYTKICEVVSEYDFTRDNGD